MGQQLRVLSANLLNGAADAVAFAELVAALDIDVLAVQEVGHAQAEALMDLFEWGEIIPAPDFTGMGLLSRHPLRVERIPLSWGFGQVGALQIESWGDPQGLVEFTNLHIAAPHMWNPWPGPLLRRRQARELDHHLRHGAVDAVDDTVDEPDQNRCVSNKSSSATPVSRGEGEPARPKAAKNASARVIVGDFNATPYWPWYRRMAAQFTDAAVAVADKTGDTPRSTWGPWPGAPRLLRIDHGFVRGLEPEAFEVLDVVGSDHSAIVMDLSSPVSSVVSSAPDSPDSPGSRD